MKTEEELLKEEEERNKVEQKIRHYGYDEDFSDKNIPNFVMFFVIFTVAIICAVMLLPVAINYKSPEYLTVNGQVYGMDSSMDYKSYYWSEYEYGYYYDWEEEGYIRGWHWEEYKSYYQVKNYTFSLQHNNTIYHAIYNIEADHVKKDGYYNDITDDLPIENGVNVTISGYCKIDGNRRDITVDKLVIIEEMISIDL